MSRFPKLTETFIVSEIVAVEKAGVEVGIYPLLRAREPVVQPAAEPLIARATYLPFVSAAIVRSQIGFILRSPRRYFGALGALIVGAWRSPRFLFGGLAIFPKVAHMARLMRAAGFDHVHCHFASHPATAGFLVHRLVGLPFSFTAHGSDLHRDRTMLCPKLDGAAFAVAISGYNRQLMAATCPGSTTPIELIHCGVDTGRFAPAERPADATLRVVCVGTLHEVKGQRYLIQACSALARRGLRVECRFVGDGVDRPMLEDLARELEVADRVVFAGSRTSDEVLAFLRDAHVLVAPSVPSSDGRREGIPVVLMEAMATGLPVIASRLSGIPELVEDGVSGLLVEAADADGIADALERLASQPALRDELGAAARAKVLAEFDVDTSARRLAEQFARSAA